MADKNFLKAYCKKSKQYFGIEVKQFNGIWKAVDFFPMTAEEAQFVKSSIRQKTFVTDETMPVCEKCGKRTVGGCKCSRKGWRCRRNTEDHAACIYCKHLKLDYITPTAVKGYHEGDIVHLSQGQTVKIRYTDNRPLTKIIVGLGWSPSIFGYQMDLDSSVLVAGENGKELVYYANRNHPSGCVAHGGDNRTGIHPDFDDKADDETITVCLDKVPEDRDKLIFLLNIFRSSVRGQTLGNVRNMYLRLYDPISEEPILDYRVDDNIKDYTALIVGMAFRKGDEWHFKAIGKGSMAKKVDALAEEALQYCNQNE